MSPAFPVTTLTIRIYIYCLQGRAILVQGQVGAKATEEFCVNSDGVWDQMNADEVAKLVHQSPRGVQSVEDIVMACARRFARFIPRFRSFLSLKRKDSAGG